MVLPNGYHASFGIYFIPLVVALIYHWNIAILSCVYIQMLVNYLIVLFYYYYIVCIIEHL